jgi:methylphosphotriester-DNA--protein-cysteine methyltransferase
MITLDFKPRQGSVFLANSYQTLSADAPLNHWIESYWQLDIPIGAFCYRSVPDNCVDLIFNVNNSNDLTVIAPFSEFKEFDLIGPATYFGVRFNILGHRSLIAAPIGEWRNDFGINATDIICPIVLHNIVEAIAHSVSFTDKCALTSAILIKKLHHRSCDSRLTNFIQYCHNNPISKVDLSDRQCAEFGLSARQLRRLTQLYLGLSPRHLARVFRFQAMLKKLNSADKLLWADNYYDQSHCIHEFKSLSGVTPNKFKKLSVLYNKN